MIAVGQLLIKDKTEREAKINYLIAKFQLDSVSNIKAQVISGGQKRRLVISLALLGKTKLLILDEPFAALDLFSIKMLQEIIVNLQTENNIGIVLCDHLARDLLSVCDTAIVLSDCKIIAKGTPSEIIRDTNAQSAYFGDSFKMN